MMTEKNPATKIVQKYTFKQKILYPARPYFIDQAPLLVILAYDFRRITKRLFYLSRP